MNSIIASPILIRAISPASPLQPPAPRLGAVSIDEPTPKNLPWNLFLSTGSPLTGRANPLVLLKLIAERGSWGPIPIAEWQKFTDCRPPTFRDFRPLVEAGLLTARETTLVPTKILADEYVAATRKHNFGAERRIFDSADPNHPAHGGLVPSGWRSFYDTVPAS